MITMPVITTIYWMPQVVCQALWTHFFKNKIISRNPKFYFHYLYFLHEETESEPQDISWGAIQSQLRQEMWKKKSPRWRLCEQGWGEGCRKMEEWTVKPRRACEKESKATREPNGRENQYGEITQRMRKTSAKQLTSHKNLSQ